MKLILKRLYFKIKAFLKNKYLEFTKYDTHQQPLHITTQYYLNY